MGELFDTFLDRKPRIALGVDPATGSRLGHLFRGVSAECCRGQAAHKGYDSDDRDCAQRPPGMAIRGASNKNYVRRVHFGGIISFWLAVRWRQFSASTGMAISSMLPGDSQPQQAKLSCLIEWHRLTLVPHQSHIPSRHACSKGIGLPSFDVQRFLRRTGTAWIGINPSGNDVLACRQVSTVVSALGKASHILAID